MEGKDYRVPADALLVGFLYPRRQCRCDNVLTGRTGEKRWDQLICVADLAVLPVHVGD